MHIHPPLYVPFTRKLGIFLLGRRESYAHLTIALRQAQIPLPVDMYLARSIYYSLAVSVFALLFSLIYIPKCGLYALLYAVPLSVLLGFITYRLFYHHPKFVGGVAGSRIDLTLPSAITYMYALSRGGVELIEIFKSLEKERHSYEGVADRIGYVVRDIEYFNIGITDALHNASRRSPSKHLRDFFEGLTTVINTGGDLTEYFRSKSEQYYKLAEIEQERYLRSVGILAEAYITVFVAGPIFLMTIIVVLGLINSNSILLLSVLVYGVIPWCTGLCILLLGSMAGMHEESYQVYTTARRLGAFDGVETLKNVESEVATGAEAEDEADLFKRLEDVEKSKRFKKFIRHPFKSFHAKPVRVLYLSVPVAIVYLVYAIHTAKNPGIEVFDDVVVLALFIILAPFTFFYEARLRKIRSMEREMPEFLRRLASMNEAGLTLTNSIRASIESKLGVLDEEVKRIWKDIEWGAVTSDALIKFETRVRTSMISRTVTLIVKANEAISDIKSVLRIAATDADAAYHLKQDRFNNMAVYSVVVYLSFFVFLTIVYVLATYFIPMIPSCEEVEGLKSGMSMLAEYDASKYLLLMFHATLIQGFCSGLVAGVMGEGNADSGLKHSLIMVAVAYLVFTQFGLA